MRCKRGTVFVGAGDEERARFPQWRVHSQDVNEFHYLALP
jgi:hypothetical protein